MSLREEISIAFTQSQNPSFVKKAEERLAQLETYPEFKIIIIQMAIEDAQAAIYLKNSLKKTKINPEQVLMILEGIQKSQHTKKIMLSAFNNCLSKIDVLEFLQPVTQLLKHDCLNGTLVLVEIVKHFQWFQGDKRGVLNTYIRELFPGLLALGTQLLSALDEAQNQNILKNIAKIYACATKMEMSPELLRADWNTGWVSMFVGIVGWTSSKTTSNLDMLWKLQKWAYTCLNSMMGRYALARKKEKKYAKFSKSFINDLAPQILKTYLNQIQSQMQGLTVSPRIKQCQLVYLEFCVRSKLLFPLLEPYVETLVNQVILPLLCFSDRDGEIWRDDQVEYVREKIDPPMEDYKTPKVAAEELIEAFVRHRSEKTFMPLMTLLNNMLINSPPSHVKYGLLTILSALSGHIQASEALKPHLIPLLTTHVIPELSSEVDYLKSKACDTLVSFDVEYPPETLSNLLSVLTSLMNHSILSCRVSAALALAPLFKFELVTEALKPHAVNIMQILMSLTETVQIDALTSTMEEFVSQFGSSLGPFATTLATRLVNTFMEMVGDEDSILAAAGVIKTLEGLLVALDGQSHQLENVLCPLVVFVLDNTIMDLYEEVVGMVCTLLYCTKKVSPLVWEIFPKIVGILEDLEYLEDVYPLLDNYIGFGREVMVQNRNMQELLVNVVKKVMNDLDVTESDRIRAMLVMESMMLNLRGGIDHIIPSFVEIGYTLLVKRKVKTSIYRIHCIEVILNAIYYNPVLTLGLLDQISWTGPFLELWFKNLEGMGRVHDKKLSIIVICELFNLPLKLLPSVLQPLWPHLIDGLVKVLATYEDALKERKRLETGDFESDYSDADEYDFGDDFDEEGEETLADLVDQAAAFAPHDEESDSDDGEWEVEEFMIEDLTFGTCLDDIDAYKVLADTMYNLSAAGRGAVIQERLTGEQQKLLEACVARARH